MYQLTQNYFHLISDFEFTFMSIFFLEAYVHEY